MPRYFEILDYRGNRMKTELDLDDLSNVGYAKIEVITGDEILKVKLKTDEYFEYDSCNGNFRRVNYYDGSYTIYSISDSINLFDNTDFLNRKQSYNDFLCKGD